MTTTTVILLALVIYGAFHLLYGRRLRSHAKRFDQAQGTHSRSVSDEPPRD